MGVTSGIPFPSASSALILMTSDEAESLGPLHPQLGHACVLTQREFACGYVRLLHLDSFLGFGYLALPSKKFSNDLSRRFRTFWRTWEWMSEKAWLSSLKAGRAFACPL